MASPALRVIAYRVAGHFDEALANRMLEHAEQRLATTLGSFVAFHDWSELDSYDTAVRLRLTGWVLRHRKRFDSIHILCQSKLVAMGVSVANLTLDRFLNHYDNSRRSHYEEALRTTILERMVPSFGSTG